MELLKKISSPSNSRLRVEEHLKLFLNNVCSFYNAQFCFLVVMSMDRKSCSVYRSYQKDSPQNDQGVEDNVAQMLMSLPPGSAVNYYSRRSKFHLTPYETYALEENEVDDPTKLDDKVAAWIGTDSFLSVPLIFHKHTIGRVYICDHKRRFTRSDGEFVFQLANYLVLMMKNTEVMDQLARDAAKDERQRIARDIHDSIIQPYIGLQMGLEGLEQKIVYGDDGVLTTLYQLQDLCREGTSELRQYVRRLKDGDVEGTGLLPSVHRFADKFSAVTGIDVRVEVGDKFRVHDYLSTEIFQMIAEGLSNIRRHTQADQAVVRLDCESERLLLFIENAGANAWPFSKTHTTPSLAFTPRSIDERARALGGDVRVETGHDGSTVVRVTVPL